jgi:hypothetical protein
MQSATPNLGGNDRYCSLRTFETGRFQGEGNDRWPGSLALRSYRGPPRGSPKYDGLSPPVEAVSFVPDSKKLPTPERAGKLRCRVGSEFGRYQRAPNLSKSAANVWSKRLTPRVPELGSRKWKNWRCSTKTLSGLCHPDYSR